MITSFGKKMKILSSSNDMSLKFGFSFSSLTDITEPQVGHLELDLENGELEVSLDDNTSEDELNYDDFTVTEFIKQAMTILFEAIEVLDENDE